LFEGINDWKIIHLTEGGKMETLEEAKDAAFLRHSYKNV